MLPKAISKMLKNAQNLEKHPLTAERVFSSIFGHIEVDSKFY